MWRARLCRHLTATKIILTLLLTYQSFEGEDRCLLQLQVFSRPLGEIRPYLLMLRYRQGSQGPVERVPHCCPSAAASKQPDVTEPDPGHLVHVHQRPLVAPREHLRAAWLGEVPRIQVDL